MLETLIKGLALGSVVWGITYFFSPTFDLKSFIIGLLGGCAIGIIDRMYAPEK